MAYDFRQLQIWQTALDLIKQVYVLTSTYPASEVHALINQTRRAAVSVAANIAKAHGRHFVKDKIKTLYIARGEIEEVRSHLLVGHELGYDKRNVVEKLVDDYNNLGRRVNAFIARIKVV